MTQDDLEARMKGLCAMWQRKLNKRAQGMSGDEATSVVNAMLTVAVGNLSQLLGVTATAQCRSENMLSQLSRL